MEKAVKGATKLKLAAPKSKYVEPILMATRSGESGVADIFRTLQLRLRDSTWTIVFKALIIVHLMIREGEPEVTLKFVAESPKRIAISTFTEVQTQGYNIRKYYEYLLERVKAYHSTKTDFVRSGTGKIRSLTVDKGLLRQTEVVQEQIRVLLKCDVLSNADHENEIAITAFRLLTLDLLELFKVMNEGTINVLEHYFEMSKVDAERALNIYKTFGRQTDKVVQYLSTARQFEMYTKLEVPKLKHAPTTLTSALEEYLNDPDFDVNRRQYLAQQEAKRTGKPMPKPQQSQSTQSDRPTVSASKAPPATIASAQAKGPAPALIDFFDSIEQNQQPMAQANFPQQQYTGGFMPQQQYQQPQMPPQQTGYNPFLQNFQPQQQQQQQPQQPQQLQSPQSLQPDFTGAGFGGYGPQPPQQQNNNIFGFQPQLAPIPQGDVASFQQEPQPQPQQMTIQQQSSAPFQPAAQQLQAQPTSTNPFRQSTMLPQSTNPFASSTSSPPPPQQQQQQELYHQQFQPQQTSPPPQPLQSQITGTNPFAKNRSPPPPAAPLAVNVTGSTNPFRQSQFVSQATGQGWQHSNQGTFAGYNMNNVDTVPAFPRPGHN